MNKIEKLGHYSLTARPSIYDEEALTALELAARTAGKVNEVVESQNHLVENNENWQKKQETEIPKQISEDVEQHITDGSFDKQIDRYAGNLEARLDNLLNSTPEGSTTMDTEVIDARVDMFGGSWENAGKSTRFQANKLLDMVTPTTRAILEAVEFTTTLGWYDANGVFHENIENHYHNCTEIPVAPGETYLIYCSYGMAFPDAIGVRSDGTMRVYHESASITYNRMDKPCHIDRDITRLLVNCASGTTMKIYKITGYEAVVPFECLTSLFNAIPKTNPATEEIATTIKTAYFLDGPSKTNAAVWSGDEIFMTTSLAVNTGEIYFVNASCGVSSNLYYLIYDATGNAIAFETCTEPSIACNKMIMMPAGARTLFVSGYKTAPKISRVVRGRAADDFSKLKWVCIGDSLTDKNIRATKNYHDYIAEKTGVQVVNMGLSGSGYKHLDDNNNAFYQRIANVPTDANVVTIFGSGNDLGHPLGEPTDTGTDTICGCINKTIDNLYSAHPTVQLGIVAPCPWIDNAPENDGSMARLTEALETICRRRGIPFLDLFHESGLRPNDETFRELYYSRDDGNGVHPDENGQKILASHFYAFLERLIGVF